mgnify:CR=1 FL=1
MQPRELSFGTHAKPQLAAAGGTPPAWDFSVSHSGPFVGIALRSAARRSGSILSLAATRLPEWVAREAVVKAAGLGVRTLRDVQLTAAGAHAAALRAGTRTLERLPGAAACLMTSTAVRELLVREVPLAELFGP